MFDLPQHRIFDFEAFEADVLPGSHPYETRNWEAIAANWRLETAANPALFNGRVTLFAALQLDGGVLRARCHMADFATFLHWRKHGPIDQAQHCFAHAMPVSRDGALLAVRMGAHTANPARVYFAAGSFEPDDVADGRLDANANMIREVAEETGLDLNRVEPEPGWHGWSGNGRTVIFRRYRFDEDAATLCARVLRFVARETDPEIDGPVVIAGPQDLPHSSMEHMPPLVAWHFANP